MGFFPPRYLGDLMRTQTLSEHEGSLLHLGIKPPFFFFFLFHVFKEVTPIQGPDLQTLPVLFDPTVIFRRRVGHLGLTYSCNDSTYQAGLHFLNAASTEKPAQLGSNSKSAPSP